MPILKQVDGNWVQEYVSDEYRYAVVKLVKENNETTARLVAGQGLPATIKVATSESDKKLVPDGKLYLIEGKVLEVNGTPYVYRHPKWSMQEIPLDLALELIETKALGFWIDSDTPIESKASILSRLETALNLDECVLFSDSDYTDPKDNAARIRYEVFELIKELIPDNGLKIPYNLWLFDHVEEIVRSTKAAIQ